jgi:hypothetical protein
MYVEVSQNQVEEAKVELKYARNYRRGWAAITAGCAGVAGVAGKLSETLNHDFQAPMAITALVAGAVALGSLTQVLDGFELVSIQKRDLRDAEYDLGLSMAEAEVQPELDFGI